MRRAPIPLSKDRGKGGKVTAGKAISSKNSRPSSLLPPRTLTRYASGYGKGALAGSALGSGLVKKPLWAPKTLIRKPFGANPIKRPFQPPLGKKPSQAPKGFNPPWRNSTGHRMAQAKGVGRGASFGRLAQALNEDENEVVENEEPYASLGEEGEEEEQEEEENAEMEGQYDQDQCAEEVEVDVSDEEVEEEAQDEDEGYGAEEMEVLGARSSASSSARARPWSRGLSVEGSRSGRGAWGSSNAANGRRTAGQSRGDAAAYETLPEVPIQKRVLPIIERREEVVPLLCGVGSSNVCCLVGETGSGKSTQVPQILVEEAAKAQQPIRICVTQPRRVAALNLAKRVAEEIGEAGPGQTVGYRIGGESVPGEHIDFCTTGYLLQLLLNAPEEFGRYTHVIIDEVHERSAESDMLCLVVRLMVATLYPQTRLVIMSATLQSDLFSNYFASVAVSPPSSIFVGAKCFPVVEHFLEDLASVYQGLRCAAAIETRIKDTFTDLKNDTPKRLDPRHCEKFLSIIVELLQLIAVPDSTILVFLPGISEISALWEESKALEDSGCFHVFPLHSMIPREEQEMVFKDPEPGFTNIVLATDIAESSITLPHVVGVIDLGLHRRVDYDGKSGITALATKWISRAAATQRAGRAGRTQAGICLRMYTKEFKEKCMQPFQPPEALSMPLDRLYLQSKQLAEKLAYSLGTKAPATAEGLLRMMVQAPELSSIHLARTANAEIGTISGDSEDARITALGRFCLQLPMEMRISRLVWIGVLWGIPADAVVLASVLSSMDPFASPSPLFIRDDVGFIDKLRGSTSARLLFDGGHGSEPLMLRQLFLEWLAQFHKEDWVYGSKEEIFRKRRKHTMNFSWHFSLSRGRMEHMVSHVQDLALKVFRACDRTSNNAHRLQELIRGLGYEVNNRNDLGGIGYKDWKAFSLSDASLETDPYLLKGLLAASFSDFLFVGSYGYLERSLDLTPPSEQKEKPPNSAERLKSQEDLLKTIYDNGLHVRQTAVFPADAQNVDAYIEFVCGHPPRREPIKTKSGMENVLLVELEQVDVDRWQPLASRATAALLEDARRLPPEFNLLSQYEKSLRDLARATKSTGSFTYGVIPMRHPCVLSWEFLQPVARGKNNIQRIEAVFDRKNAPGFVSHCLDLNERGRLPRFVKFAVAASATGSENPGRAYPTGVTTLSAAHMAFILATAKLGPSKLGFLRYAFTASGALAILFRSFELPEKCIDRTRWDLIVRLREAMRQELGRAEETVLDGGSWRGQAPILFDSPVQEHLRALVEMLPFADDKDIFEDPTDCPAGDLPWNTIDLDGSTGVGPKAFAPLAPWAELERRRFIVMERLAKRSVEIKDRQRFSRHGDSQTHRDSRHGSTSTIHKSSGCGASRKTSGCGSRSDRKRSRSRGSRTRDRDRDRRHSSKDDRRR